MDMIFYYINDLYFAAYFLI